MASLVAGCAGPVIVMPWAEPSSSKTGVIYFDRDAYKVDDSYRELLEAHARRMRHYPALRLRIEATTDRHGALEYNRALSRKRAETVMKELVALGVPAERIEVVARGEARHAARTASNGSGAADRRVELIYH